MTEELPCLQTDGNRLYKDMRNYVSAVRGETSLSSSKTCGLVASAGLMVSIVLLQTCVKLPDASPSLCLMLMTLAGLGRRT